MKRILYILLILIIFAFAAFLAVPALLKKSLLEFSERTLSRELNATVELADLKISLLRNFPDAGLEIQNIVIRDRNNLSGDTLLTVPVLRTSVGLASLFNPSNMKVSEIEVEDASLHLQVNGEEKAAPTVNKTGESSNQPGKSENDENEKLTLVPDKISVRNSSLVYDNSKTGLQFKLKDINLDVSGEMFGSETSIGSAGSIGDVSLRFGGVRYLSGSRVELKSAIDADFGARRFTIAENEILLNRLPLQLNGSVSMSGDSTFFDLSLHSKATDLKTFLALVPEPFDPYLKEIETSGDANIEGAVTGYYFGGDYPELNFRLNVVNGRLQYAGHSQAINNIGADIRLEKPQGDLDQTLIIVQNAQAQIGGDTVAMNLAISTPVSDPGFDGGLRGRIDLSQLEKALPLDSLQISGIIDAELNASGKYSDLENEAYDQILSNGTVHLQNLVYESPKLTRPVLVPLGSVSFSPRNIRLDDLRMLVGQSDFRLSGTVSNYLNYLLKKGTLQADLQLNSRRVNLNELFRLKVKEKNAAMQASVSASPAGDAEEKVEAFEVPERVDLTFRSNISSALINRIPVSNIHGVIKAADQKLMLQNLSMNMLEGQLTLNGSYRNTLQNQPLFDFGFDIRDFDIPTLFSTFSGFREKAPGAVNSSGKLNSKMQLSGRLDQHLAVIPGTANGEGSFGTRNLQIVNSPVFTKLNGIIQKDRLRNVNVDDFEARLNVKNGNLLLQPFQTRVIGQETKVEGSISAENEVDMRLDFNVERSAFGPDIQKILAVIPGNEKIKMLPAGVTIKGPVSDPKVNPDLSQTTKAVTDATKDDLKNSLEKLGKGIFKMFKH